MIVTSGVHILETIMLLMNSPICIHFSTFLNNDANFNHNNLITISSPFKLPNILYCAKIPYKMTLKRNMLLYHFEIHVSKKKHYKNHYKNLMDHMNSQKIITDVWSRNLNDVIISDIDECLSSPCQNSGQCNDLVNAYSCTCLHAYDGTHCEISKITM